ncbi:MAG TPA: TfuA-like protein [Kofleriaceae bacterium]
MSDEAVPVVFLGPSLPREEARALLPADYRPPVAKGDIYALLTTGVNRIVVIDGVFHGGPSVWQRELLAAIDAGIEVLGASSMGALRAAELYPLGMQGFGTVFDWYRSGFLDGDDEVALRHSNEEFAYRALSEPLVNIRATLQQAVTDGCITAVEEHELVAFAKRMYYPDRSHRALLTCPLVLAWPAERRDAFSAYLDGHAVDVKAQDARLVLEHCAHHPPRASRDLVNRVDPWSAEFRQVALKARRLTFGDASIGWTDLRNAMKRSRADWGARLARFKIDWCLADLARLRGATCPDDAYRAYVTRWTREQDGHDLATALRLRGLTPREHAEILAMRAHVRWLREAGPAILQIPWDRAAGERLARALPATAAAGALRADDAAFLSAWLEAHGFSAPRSDRQRRLAAWKLTPDARRREPVHGSVSLAGWRQALDQRIAATWLLTSGLEAFGRFIDPEMNTVQAFQFSAPFAELSAVAALARSP